MTRDAARRLETAAWLLLAALPLAMAVANRSAPALLVIAAFLALAGRIAGGELDPLRTAATRALRSPIVAAILAFVALALLSLLWSQHRAISTRGLAELGIAGAAATLLHVSLPRAIPRYAIIAAGAFMAAGCSWTLFELATGSAFRASLGFRSEPFIFKRSVTSILVVFWPVALCLWRRDLRAAALAIAALLLAAIVWSHAAAALLGFGTGLGCLLVALRSRRITESVVALGLFTALALAPLTGSLAARVLPPSVLDALEDSQARDRVLIWQSFGEVVRARPVLGTGFGTSSALGSDPVSSEVPPDRRVMLAVGHPHNGYLQIWVELGAVGAILAGLVLALLWRAVHRSDWRTALPALAAIGCSAAIMLVAHGAWQGWWIATIGATAIWSVRSPSIP